MRIDRIKLIAEMARQRITVSELSEKSGVSRITLSAIRSGKNCSAETAHKIAAALSVPLPDLADDNNHS